VTEPWLIAGLGNPGEEYARTRHNLGFRVADELARRHGMGFRRTRYRAQEASGQIQRAPVRLLKPQTYMNESGFAVNRAASFHKIPLERILIVHDDIDLPVARLRFRDGGSSGGNNGVKSVIASMRGDAFWRLKIGVGRPPREEAIDHVLTPFRKEEAPLIEEAIVRAADAVETFLGEGPLAAMNRYSG
jgi:peptidyl-tRNA hydrolase, PTH1 family